MAFSVTYTKGKQQKKGSGGLYCCKLEALFYEGVSECEGEFQLAGYPLFSRQLVKPPVVCNKCLAVHIQLRLQFKKVHLQKQKHEQQANKRSLCFCPVHLSMTRLMILGSTH